MARKKSEGEKLTQIAFKVSPGRLQHAKDMADGEGMSLATFNRKCWEDGLDLQAQKYLTRRDAIAFQRSQQSQEEESNSVPGVAAEDVHE